jgi:succinyl-CoA synthetase beta subunit
MKLQEYRSKEILERHGVPLLAGEVARSPEEARAAAERIGGPVVVKAQVLVGGRGKAGGVKLAEDPDEAESRARDIIGLDIKGTTVRTLLIAPAAEIAKEFYLGLILDRTSKAVTVIASAEGGVEIEEVAASHPEKILREAVDPAVGFLDFQGRKLAYGLGLTGPTVNKFVQFCSALYKMYVDTDASLVEINPLVILKDGNVVALDAKVNFDENALYRHKELLNYRDLAEEEPRETQAKEHDLAYIALEGNIGCMVNGAGLAMATMDTIKLVGGSPANFLDVGGGANKEKVTAAFKLILADPNVKAVLVNIFGGIMKCDVIAEGIIAAAKEVQLKVPLVVRLEGTNVEQGKALLSNSGLAITPADNLRQAAEKAVAAAQ